MKLVDELPPNEQKEYLELLNDPTVAAYRLAAAVQKRNVSLSDKSINKHRYKECLCVAK